MITFKKYIELVVEKSSNPISGMDLPPGFNTSSIIKPLNSVETPTVSQDDGIEKAKEVKNVPDNSEQYPDKTEYGDVEKYATDDTNDDDSSDDETFDEVDNPLQEAFNEVEASLRQHSPEEVEAHFQRSYDKDYTKKKDEEGMLSKKLSHGFVHQKNLQLVTIVDDAGNEMQKIDLDAFKKLISVRPKNLLAKNQKMVKSGNAMQVFFNTTLPALNGIALNEATNDFITVMTCKNAGGCRYNCYAMGNNYIRFKGSSLRSTKILNFLLNDFTGYKAQLRKELGAKLKTSNRRQLKTVLRWNDAGDMISEVYFKMVLEICNEMPDILFYFYTKEIEMVKRLLGDSQPPNLIVNYSRGGRQDNLIDENDKTSVIVPESGLRKTKIDLKQFIRTHVIYKNEKVIDKIKNMVSERMNIPFDKILTIDEVKNGIPDNGNGYYVMRMPGGKIFSIGAANWLDFRRNEDLNEMYDILAKKGWIISKWKYNSPDDVLKFKKALALEYNVDANKLLTDEELINTDIGDVKEYNSIVLPGESDTSATRPDVKITFLFEH